MAEFAGGEPVLQARLALDITDATQSIDDVAKYAEGTFAGVGKGGGNQAARERSVRAQESARDEQMAKGSVIGRAEAGSAAYQNWMVRHELYQDTFQNRQDASWLRQQQRDADKYHRDHDREEATITRQQDRNESRYSKSKADADFASFRQNRNDVEKLSRGGSSPNSFDFPDRDYDDEMAPRSRPGHADRLQRNRDLMVQRAVDRGEAEGPDIGPWGGGSEEEGMSQLASSRPGFFRKNLPTFSKLFGKSSGGGLGVFYKRFLAMEALRSISQGVSIASEHDAGMLRAGGDPLATAQFQLQEAKAEADMVPFVGGLFYGAMNFGTGASTAVASAELGQRQVAGLEARRGLARQRADISGETSVATSPRGYARTIAGLNDDERKATVEAQLRAEAEGKLITDSANQKKAETSANQAALAGQYGYEEAEYRTNEALAAVDRQTSVSRTGAAQRLLQEKADVAARFQRRRDEAAADMGMTAYGNAKAGDLYERQAKNLLRPSGTDFFDPVFQGRQKQQDLQFEEQRREADEDHDLAVFNAHNQGDESKSLRTAERKRVMGERHLREAGNKVQSAAIDAETNRNVGLQFIGDQERYGAASAALDRDPRAAIENTYTAQVRKNAYLPFAQRVAGDLAAGRVRAAANQSQDDRMFLEGSSLDLREQVSGLQARSYGPGGDAIRRQAELTAVSGNAELQAQSILRDPSVDKDKRQAFADTARRTGINELEGYAANYAAGFRSVETSRYNVAAGNKDSANPSAVFGSIDEAEKGLRDKLGTGATSTNAGGGAIQGMIAQIIQLLQSGSIFSAVQ